MTPLRRPAAFGALTVLAAVGVGLAGCTASSTGPSATSDWSDSPLNQYLAPVWGTDLDDADFAAQNDRIEGLIATCMKAEGFEYTPVPYIQGQPGDWLPDDRDWVAQWGYGATVWPGKEETEQTAAEGDVNSEYVATLSESEQTAYYAVLYGPQPTEEEAAAATSGPIDWQDQGCYGSASHEVRGDDATQLPENQPIMDAIDAFSTSQADAPELGDLDREWADCMAAAGHDGFAKQGDAQQSVYDDLDDYYSTLTDWVPDSPELDAFHDQEVELALADLDCRERTSYRQRSLAVQWAAEEQFIADHRAELDALVASAAGSQG